MKKMRTILFLTLALFVLVSVIGLAQTFPISTTKIIASTGATPVIIDTGVDLGDDLFLNIASIGDLPDRKPAALIDIENTAHQLNLCLMGGLLSAPVLNQDTPPHVVSTYSEGSLDYNLTGVTKADFVLSFTGPVIEKPGIKIIELDNCLPVVPKQAQILDESRLPTS